MTENTGAPAITKRPSWICSTWVATPFIGARTVVKSRLRWASSRAALRLQVGRKRFERQIGVAEQLVQGIRVLHPDQLQLRLCGDQSGAAVVEIELRSGIALDQR